MTGRSPTATTCAPSVPGSPSRSCTICWGVRTSAKACAREWDYLFHFRTAQGVTTCQYKVVFDRDYTGRSFHWSPAACAALLDVPAAAPAAATSRFELSGDALFAFDRHAVEDLLPGGREQIAAIAAELNDSDVASVQVIGHTDLLGSDAYNRTLSQQRALSVRRLLIEQGIAPAMVTALGAGMSQPLKTCDTALPLPARIACEPPAAHAACARSAGAPPTRSPYCPSCADPPTASRAAAWPSPRMPLMP